MMKAILLGNGSREGVLDGVEALTPILERFVEIVVADFSTSVDLTEVDADMAIVFGGDGSILRAVHQMGMNQLPILAVSLGTLGFLSNVSPDGVQAFFESKNFPNFSCREQLLLNCSVWRKRRLFVEPDSLKTNSPGIGPCVIPSRWLSDFDDRFCFGNYLVVNEVAVQCGAPFSILKIDLAVDGDRVTTFRGDGLVVATPVGSTGLNLSAGGPVLRNNLEDVVIKPISPQTLSFRPVVDSANRVYEMQAVTGEAFLVIDGVSLLKLSHDDLIVIRRSPLVCKMIEVPGNQYYCNLQKKLGWGIDHLTRRTEVK